MIARAGPGRGLPALARPRDVLDPRSPREGDGSSRWRLWVFLGPNGTCFVKDPRRAGPVLVGYTAAWTRNTGGWRETGRGGGHLDASDPGTRTPPGGLPGIRLRPPSPIGLQWAAWVGGDDNPLQQERSRISSQVRQKARPHLPAVIGVAATGS